MFYLVYLGMPPAYSIQLMIWMVQMKMMSAIVAARYLQATEHRQHLSLPPGEQYRRTVQAGGYRP